MPIVFQPAEPVAPATSRGAGAAAQWSQDLPTLARQQQGVADAYLHAATLQQRQQQASAALQAQQQTHAAGLDQQSYLAGQQYGLAREQMAHQSDLQAQHAQLQDQLAQNQLSRGEQLRLQRLREARGAVREQVDAGSLTAEEGDALQLQIQTGINPLEARDHRARQQHLELQNQIAQRQVAQFDQLQRERDEFHAQGFAGRLAAFVDDDGSVRRVALGPDRQVDWHTTQLLFGHQYGGGEHGARGGSGGGSGTGGGRNAPAGRPWHELTHAEQVSVNNHVEEQMRREQAAATGQAGAPARSPWMDEPARFDAELVARRNRYLANLGAPAEGRQTPEQQEAAQALARAQTEQQVHQAAVRQWNLRNRAALHAGRMTYEEFQRRGHAQGQLAVLGHRLRGQHQTQGVAPAPLRPAGTEEEQDAASARRFSDEEMGGLGAAQRAVAGSFNDLRTRIDSLPEGRRENLADSLNRAQRIITRYGDVRAMPPAERQRYEALMRAINRLPAPQPQRPGGPRPDAGLLEESRRGLGHIGNEILGVPERVLRGVQGQEQRPFGNNPYGW